MSQVLGKTCTACNVERRKKGAIKYHPETFMPYCENPYICNELHPNSSSNTLDRAMELGKEKAELHLMDLEEAKEKYGTYLMLTSSNPKRAERIRKLVTQPFTFRIGTAERAEFLMNLQEEFNMPNMTEALRYCIDTMNESKGMQYRESARMEKEQKVQREVESIMSTLNEPEEPEQPQTVDSDQDDQFTF